jgi:hypothetical protein
MKRHHVCPKCAGKRIWVIEKFRIPSEDVEGQPLPLVPHQADDKPRSFGFTRVSPRGHVDLLVCDGCGYAELWAGGTRDLVEDPARGIRLLDTSKTAAGPFR